MKHTDYNKYMGDPNGSIQMGSKECVQVKTLDQALDYLREKLGVEGYTNVDIKCDTNASRAPSVTKNVSGTFQITVVKGTF